MEKYKGIYYDGETSIPFEIETLSPKEIVDQIKEVLNKFDKKNWDISSIMIDPQNLSVMFELIEKIKNGYGSKYDITISEKHLPKINK